MHNLTQITIDKKSVLPIISKIIEKCIHRHLITFLYKNHLLTKFQFGFRPKLSTDYAATVVLIGMVIFLRRKPGITAAAAAALK